LVKVIDERGCGDPWNSVAVEFGFGEEAMMRVIMNVNGPVPVPDC
jgi:hypothetical protein